MAGIITYKTFLMIKKGGKYEKLVDIKTSPAMGGNPEMLDTTTLSDRMETKVLGIQKLEPLKFETNYTLDDYKKLKEIESKQNDFAVWYGGTELSETVIPTGEDGKWKFSGTLKVTADGGSVNTVRKMTITIAPSTIIAFDNSSNAGATE